MYPHFSLRLFQGDSADYNSGDYDYEDGDDFVPGTGSTIGVGGSEGDSGDEMYVMTVRLRREGEGEVARLEQTGESAQARAGDVVTAETRFETRAQLGLAVEKCWLTRWDITNQCAFDRLFTFSTF